MFFPLTCPTQGHRQTGFRHRCRHGAIDILVNNAGLTRDNLSMRMKDEEWNDVIAVNMTATFKLAKAVQRGMMKRRNGRIINIASVVGVMGTGQCNYVAIKPAWSAGQKRWDKVASRGSPSIVAPGFIATSMTEVLTDDQKQKYQKHHPDGQNGNSKRHRRRRHLSGFRWSRLRHRNYPPRQWRHGNDLRSFVILKENRIGLFMRLQYVCQVPSPTVEPAYNP